MEYQKQEERVAALQADPNCCPHELAKQKEVLEETARMLPSCRERISQAKNDLCSFLVDSGHYAIQV